MPLVLFNSKIFKKSMYSNLLSDSSDGLRQFPSLLHTMHNMVAHVRHVPHVVDFDMTDMTVHLQIFANF